MSFAQLVISSRSELAVRVNAKDAAGNATWYMLLLKKHLVPFFNKDIKSKEVISPKDYGDVIVSGYGKPSKSVLRKLPEKMQKLFEDLL